MNLTDRLTGEETVYLCVWEPLDAMAPQAARERG